MSRVGTGGRWQMQSAFADAAAGSVIESDGITSPDKMAVTRLHVHEPPAPLPGEYRSSPVKKTRIIHPRTSSNLPVPKPLPEATAAGHFGHDEDGTPIRPSPDEVREITAGHAETLRGAIHDGQHDVFEQGVTQYAESFGPEAAERLRSHVQRLARQSVGSTWRR